MGSNKYEIPSKFSSGYFGGSQTYLRKHCDAGAIAKKTSAMLECINRNIKLRSIELAVPLYSALVRVQLEY